MSFQPGDVILNGKYHILRFIGEGGMARVWLAEELTFGQRQVALKEPRADLLPDLAQEVRLRYQREVQVCAALEQAKVPHIVRALTAEPYGSGLLLVMEYLPGGDLATLLRQHPGGLPVERAIEITLDLLRALEGVHAHEMEVVHRDVKPSNILFDKEGRAHVADFGLAQVAGGSQNLTKLLGGGVPGTPLYAAPEQEAGIGYLTPAADLYALGCVLFEMLTGKRYKRVRPGTPASSLRPDLPVWVDRILDKALAEDPWGRYQMADRFRTALQEGRRHEADLNRLYEAAQTAAAAQAWETVIRCCEEIEELEPRYLDTADLRALAETELRLADSYKRLQAAVEAGDWNSAVEVGRQVVAERADYRDAAELLARADAQLSLADLYERLQAAVDAGDWDAAVERHLAKGRMACSS